jgi:uncharacterized damage-inducible protein DinB
MHRLLWFDRRSELGFPAEASPYIVERVRGAPARLEDRVSGLPPGILGERVEDSWSILENVGHLGDLEPLWAGRLADRLAGRPELRPADLQNRRTHEADHNERSMSAVDLFFLVAEHDDHHIARITALAQTLATV